MGPTKYLDREIPTISLANFDSRIDEITQELVEAAEHVGFFCIVSYSSSKHVSVLRLRLVVSPRKWQWSQNREEGPLIVFKGKSPS
jgi:hypothetical protein